RMPVAAPAAASFASALIGRSSRRSSAAAATLPAIPRRGGSRGCRFFPCAQKLTQEEVRALVLEGSRYLPPKHHAMLVNLLDLEKITVNDIMTPRREIDALDLDASVEEIRSKLETGYHTRLPVCRGQPDNIIG